MCDHTGKVLPDGVVAPGDVVAVTRAPHVRDPCYLFAVPHSPALCGFCALP